MKKTMKMILAMSTTMAILTASTAALAAGRGGRNGGGMTRGGWGSNSITVTNPADLPDTSDVFTNRDLEQTADLSNAQTITVTDGANIEITDEGVYVLTGTAQNATVTVSAEKTAKVQLVLDSLNVVNSNNAVIYVKSADKVFITTQGDSSLSVTGTFTADGTTNVDGVIFSKTDLVLNGTATLTIQSTANGVVSKDKLKVTGGTYQIQASSKGLEANDAVLISGGDFTIIAGTDGIHAENSDDDTLGYVYISGGTFSIRAGDDGLHAVSLLRIDGGTFQISAAEGMEATVIEINDGTIAISATDDGINAAQKSKSYNVLLTINGGTLTITMSSGDTDGLDANGDLTINGGAISISGNSAIDYDNSAQLNGGTVIVNGQQVTSLAGMSMFGGGRGGWGW